MLDRREFLIAGIGLAGEAALPKQSLRGADLEVEKLPSARLHASDEEAYWAKLRKQFLIPRGVVFLNNASIGSSPKPVLRAIFDACEEIERVSPTDPEDYPFWGYGRPRPFSSFRDRMASFVGCTRDELALTRSATEGINLLANGCDMKAGDEVLMTNEEHSHGEEPWHLKAKRYGTSVRKVQLPRPVSSATQVLELFDNAITDRTRVLFFSHITTETGVVLPVKDLCALARGKGILSFVDGAQALGMMRVNVRELGCDAYSASAHKWLQGPKGTGMLYVRDEVIDRIWNTFASEGWDDPTLRAQRFQQFGTSNVPCLWGLKAAIQFAEEVGLERIERRHRELADHLLEQLTLHGATSWSSPDPALRCGIVTVNVPPIQRMPLETWLWQKHRIRIRGSEPSKLRLSTAYFLQRTELDRFLERFDEYKEHGG